MSTDSQYDIDPPECSECEIPMDLAASGAQKSVPLVGTEIEYVRFSCSRCGQGARFERESRGEEWTQASV